MIKMKKRSFLYLIIAILLIGCYPYKRSSYRYNQDENWWITGFKDAVFYFCIREGYQNDSIFVLMREKDLLSSMEMDVSIIYNQIQLGKNIGGNIPKPYRKIDNPRDTSKKLILASCLHYYASRELDSIARVEYKKHLKREKREAEFWKSYGKEK